MLLILYSISGVNSRNGGKMVRKKMVEKWILNGFHFDKGILTDSEFEPPEGLPRGNGGPGESAGHRTGGCHVSKAKGRPGNVVCEDEGG